MVVSLECFFYNSCITEDADLAYVASIVKTARNFNKSVGITGMLVFDGQRFFQYIEGPKTALDALVSRIASDTRHTGFKPMYRGALTGERMFVNWSMAYVLVDDSEPLDELNQLEGQQALSRLQSLIPLLDIA